MRRFRARPTILMAVLALAGWAVWSPAQTAHFGFPSHGPNNGGPPDGNGPRGPGRQQSDSPVEQLGQKIFFDTDISNPPGMACATCHSPDAGFSNGNSYVNERFGTVPGSDQSRFGSRKPLTISYSWFVPDGPTFWRRREAAWAGGFFSDGRAQSLEDQASAPMFNPNEMDNVLHGLSSPALVVRKVATSSYSNLVEEAFGGDALSKSSADIFHMIRQAIASFEKSRAVSPFSSKYDAYVDGQTQLTEPEMDGLRLFTGSVTGRPGGAANYKSAQCVSCHRISDSSDGRRDFFTNWTFANIGIPKNPQNPFYKQTNAAADPLGYNPDGDRFVDLGLGAILYPARNLPPGNIGPESDGRGDFLAANGEFRVPSLRNVDKRPNPDFVKCYMHNGVFKSLKAVVHFYNTRNLTSGGDVIDLASAALPANLKGRPVWPPPEYASAITLQNPAGHRSSLIARVGNLGLTDREENEIVAFLETLSDGYFAPSRRRPPPN